MTNRERIINIITKDEVLIDFIFNLGCFECDKYNFLNKACIDGFQCPFTNPKSIKEFLDKEVE